MKAIAVFTDSKGKTVPIDSEGQFMIHKEDGDGWRVMEVIPFAMDPSKGIADLRHQLRSIAERLKCCSHIIAEKINGLPYTVLDPMDFELWEIEGQGTSFFDEIVAEAAVEVAETGADSSLTPRILKDGHYYLDLKVAMKKTKGTRSSKEILIPFFEKQTFYELKVLCDHIPPWFDKKLDSYGLTYKVSDRGHGELTAIIRPSICGE